MTDNAQSSGQPVANATNAPEHVRLDFMGAGDISLQKRLCASCIMAGLIESTEAKEKDIQQEISDLNKKIWLNFSALMNEDCLNSARPDQFLPMKNILKIKMMSDGATTPNAEPKNNPEVPPPE